MRARIVRNAERFTEHTVRLQPLKVGDRVFIQNQTGNLPLRWDWTNLVIEVKQFDQYAVRVDGSGRVTLRNRKILRKVDKIIVDHIPGTTHTIQPLKTPTTPRICLCESTNQPSTGKRSTYSKAANTATGNKASSSDRCTVYTTPPRDTGSYN